MNTPDIHQTLRDLLLPLMGRHPAEQVAHSLHLLAPHVRVRHAIAGEYLEEPCPAREGRALLLPHALAHSFVLLGEGHSQRPSGTMIWPRRSLIFHPDALLDDQPIQEYTQCLEPGPYLSLHYPPFRQALEEASALRHSIHILSRLHTTRIRQHHYLRSLHPPDRVARLEDLYPAFCYIATLEQKALHTGLTRQTYAKKYDR